MPDSSPVNLCRGMSHSRPYRFLTPKTTLVLTVALLLAGCINISLPGEETLFVKGEPFVARGTMAVADVGGPCPVWIGQNGITYHLFQGVYLDNDDFDRVTTPGVTSRLELATRGDLKVDCAIGTIVEVLSVLEIVE